MLFLDEAKYLKPGFILWSLMLLHQNSSAGNHKRPNHWYELVPQTTVAIKEGIEKLMNTIYTFDQQLF